MRYRHSFLCRSSCFSSFLLSRLNFVVIYFFRGLFLTTTFINRKFCLVCYPRKWSLLCHFVLFLSLYLSFILSFGSQWTTTLIINTVRVDCPEFRSCFYLLCGTCVQDLLLLCDRYLFSSFLSYFLFLSLSHTHKHMRSPTSHFE